MLYTKRCVHSRQLCGGASSQAPQAPSAGGPAPPSLSQAPLRAATSLLPSRRNMNTHMGFCRHHFSDRWLRVRSTSTCLSVVRQHAKIMNQRSAHQDVHIPREITIQYTQRNINTSLHRTNVSDRYSPGDTKFRNF